MADPNYDVTCKDCGNTFQRRTLIGRAPERCHDCKSIKKQKAINKLHESTGRKTRYPEDKPVLEPPPEPIVVDKAAIPPLPDLPKYEESWLDDDAAQAQLLAKKTETFEPEELTPLPEDPDRLSCSVRSCQGQPTQVNRFCLHHWLRVPLDTRGVLLGCPPGTPPFDAAMGKALRSLR